MRASNKRQLGLARAFRQKPTDAERLLWSLLPRKQLEGLKFKRQHPIPPYIVDFVCEEKRLIVEIDGSGHVESRRDQERDAYLERHGFRVLRFWSNEVMRSPTGVADAILDAIGFAPR